MRILIVSDAWHPQVNGVVRTLTKTREVLERRGHVVEVIGPEQFRRVPCPTYPEIELSILPYRRLVKLIEAFAPDAIHIATEGPLGMAARKYCKRNDLIFTTAYHTKFPEYIHERTKLPLKWSYAFMRWFHGGSAGVMVATDSLAKSLSDWGFENLKTWSRGVDIERFKPRGKDILDLPRPIYLYAGRVVVDKNIEAFLQLKLDGTKLVVGIGPDLEGYRAKYPEAVFAGYLENGHLASYFAAADVFVFPSLTDTFGLVLLEALKSPAFYIGALGSRANTAKRKERLALFDLSEAEINRLHGPIGLDIGSRTPGEIAVSILAEIIAVRNPVELRQKKPVQVTAPACAT